MKRIGITTMTAVILTAATLSCAQAPATQDATKDDTMFQSATLQSLMLGNYDGFVSVGTLRTFGDIGLGTFESVDGEMIILDGTVYQAKSDGSVVTAGDSVMVPFAASTHFDSDISFSIEGASCLDSLLSRMSDIVNAKGPNFIYAVRIDVNGCDYVKARSVIPQQKPYKPLAEALKTDQREFTFKDVDGTIVGVWFPAYMAQLNAAGWHCHFISTDRTKGGHLLDIVFTGKADIQLDLTPTFTLYMPEEEGFAGADLSKDLSKDIEAVEKSHQ